MAKLPEKGERAILVHVDFTTSQQTDDLTEFITLANSAGVLPVSVMTHTRHSPDAKYFIGIGKVTEIQQAITACAAEYVIFNHNLSPSQQRNLEKILVVRVLHRTQLIFLWVEFPAACRDHMKDERIYTQKPQRDGTALPFGISSKVPSVDI